MHKIKVKEKNDKWGEWTGGFKTQQEAESHFERWFKDNPRFKHVTLGMFTYVKKDYKLIKTLQTGE